MSQNTSNSIKTITGTCGGRGSWLQNALGNAGPGSGSILSLPPYSSSSPTPRSLFEFPGILSQSGGGRRIRRIRIKTKAKARRTRRKSRRRAKRTRKH
jgi:hypothetical protein